MSDLLRWRLSVPWTAAQIAAAIRPGPEATGYKARQLHEWADHILTTKRFSQAAVNQALPALVTTCACCGAPARYRYGYAGRCAAHRDVRPTYWRDRQTRFEAGADAVADQDAKLRIRDNARRRAHQVSTNRSHRP